MTEQNPFQWRHFQPDIILLCVRLVSPIYFELPRPGRNDGKGQVQEVEKGDVRGQVALIARLFGVVA